MWRFVDRQGHSSGPGSPKRRSFLSLHVNVTNMATTSFTLVGNSADSRGLSQCRDPVYGTPFNAAVHLRRAERPKEAAGLR
jgi:hypothetical protein